MIEKSDLEVLILDDEVSILKGLRLFVESLGYLKVLTFDRGSKALDWMGRFRGRPDVILLDLNMPEMDGIEFVRKLVSLDYAGNLILVSAMGERMLESTTKLIEAHKMRVLGHIEKPVKLEMLGFLIEKVSRRSLNEPEMSKKIYSADEVRTGILNGELINHYQPKVAVPDGEIVGVEALVRWQHREDGLVFPGQFVGVAEKYGLIDELTEMVLVRALAQARVWQEEGVNLSMAVNISMDNLDSLDFPDLIEEQAAEAGVPPENIVLEVTETRLMHNPLASIEILNRLRLKGFNLSIDDFGTGNSTLLQLRNIPFNQLKVDQGFVNGAWKSSTLRAIYNISLDLAGQLGMEVVAEGVEDAYDWEFLRNSGCDMAQGYFISRPMPPEEWAEWLKKWKVRVKNELFLRKS